MTHCQEQYLPLTSGVPVYMTKMKIFFKHYKPIITFFYIYFMYLIMLCIFTENIGILLTS